VQHLPRNDANAIEVDGPAVIVSLGHLWCGVHDCPKALRVRAHIRFACDVEVKKYPKYACTNAPACGITSAERPTGIVEGDKYDTTVVTQILTNKFAYHLPFYRQQDMFAGTGWIPSRGTMLNLLVNCFFVIQDT